MTTSPRPSDYDLANGFWALSWRNCAIELVMANVCEIMKKSGDAFRPFTFDEYTSLCGHEVVYSEMLYLDTMVSTGHLRKEGYTYHFNGKFFAEIESYLNTPERRQRLELQKQEVEADNQNWKAAYVSMREQVAQVDNWDDLIKIRIELGAQPGCVYVVNHQAPHKTCAVRIDFPGGNFSNLDTLNGQGEKVLNDAFKVIKEKILERLSETLERLSQT